MVVFNNLDDFRDYSRDSVGVTHRSLLGYCHLKTDEDGNTFYELVTYEHTGLWQVLAHEGFHQFLGYELGREIPVWLNEGMAQYFEFMLDANQSGNANHTFTLTQLQFYTANSGSLFFSPPSESLTMK